MNFVKNFVYSNWNNINYKYKTTDIIIDPEEEDEYINDEEDPNIVKLRKVVQGVLAQQERA